MMYFVIKLKNLNGHMRLNHLDKKKVDATSTGIYVYNPPKIVCVKALYKIISE